MATHSPGLRDAHSQRSLDRNRGSGKGHKDPQLPQGFLREKETNKFVAAVGRCFAFLDDIGESTPNAFL